MTNILSQTKKDDLNNKSSLILTNQTKLVLSGIQEVCSTNDKNIILKTNNKKLSITGSNINITKLLVDTGELEAEGIFDSIKYTYTSKDNNVFKRMFK